MRFGKDATCAASLCALVAGDVVSRSRYRRRSRSWCSRSCSPSRGCSAHCSRAGDAHAEQVAIGIGARTGNGLLLCVLAGLIVSANGASELEAAVLAAGVAAVFCLSFLSLASRPDAVTIGYKG